MTNKRKILIISGEAWRDDSNGGNVLSNLFAPLKNDFDFAQIYTNPALPSNDICKKYFHLSEAKMLKSVFTRKPFGEKLELHSNDQSDVTTANVLYKLVYVSIFKKFFINSLYFLQNLFWCFSYWKSDNFIEFIEEYKPDIIFAPLYSGIFLHRIDRYVAKLTGKKLISYVSDDVITFRHFSFSPVFWLNRFILRHNVIKTAKYYSLLYTMTQEQLEEYQPILKVPMKILTKSGDFNIVPVFKDNYQFPIKLIYAGNLIYNRYKTLAELVKVIRKLNQDQLCFQLDIYTQTPITEELKELLHDGRSSFLNGKISTEELKIKYSESDILLHVESFELKQKLLTRISFSTKIVDLLHSRRAVMAICWDQSSPYKYLKREDAAICVSDLSEIDNTLLSIRNNPQLLRIYAEKAWECGLKNHNTQDITSMIENDFLKL